MNSHCHSAIALNPKLSLKPHQRNKLGALLPFERSSAATFNCLWQPLQRLLALTFVLALVLATGDTTAFAQTAPPSRELKLWLRSDFGVRTYPESNNNHVWAWWAQNDATFGSIHGAHFAQQGDGNMQPLLVPNALNGYPAVRFSGGQQLDLPAIVQTVPCDIFLVYRNDPASTGYRILLNRSASTSPYPPGIYASGHGSDWHPNVWWNNDHAYSQPMWLYGDPGIVRFRLRSNEIGITVDGGPETVIPHNQSALSTWTTLCHAGVQQFIGDIAEVMIYNTDLSPTEAQAATSYLRNKYFRPNVPGGVTAVAGEQAVSLTWHSTPGATGYKIKRATTAGGPYTVLNNDAISSTRYVDSQVDNDVTYYYVVMAVTPLGDSADSTQVSATPRLFTTVAPPANALRVWLKADRGISLNGSNVTSWTNQGSLNFQATQGSSGAQPVWTTLAINDQPAVRFDGIDDFLRHNALDIMGNSNDLSIFMVVKPTGTQAVHANILDFDVGAVPHSGFAPQATDSANNTFAFYWFAENGWRSVGWPALGSGQAHSLSMVKTSPAWGGNGNPTGTSYLNGNLVSQTWVPASMDKAVHGLTLGSNAYYPERLFKGEIAEILIYNKGLSEVERQQVQNYLNFTYFTPKGLRAAAGNGSVELNWFDTPRATRYKVKRATNPNGPYTILPNDPTSATYTDASVTNGVKYYYKVAAVIDGVSSADSPVASAIPYASFTMPTDLTAVTNGTQVRLSWTATAYGSQVWIQRSDNYGGPYTNLAPVGSQVRYTDNNPNRGQRQHYRLAAWGQYSNVAIVAVPPTVPQNVTATAGNAQVHLSWNAATGATSYVVKRATTEGGPYTPIGSPTSTSYTDSTAANGTTYYYVIAAHASPSGIPIESDNSAEVSAKPFAMPSNLTAVSNQHNRQIQLTWTATGYGAPTGLQRSSTSTFSTSTALGAIDSLTTYTDTDNTIAYGQTYFYRLSSGGQYSNVAAVTVPPATPGGVTATAGNAQVRLSWSAATGASNYIVKRATSSGGTYTTIASPTETRYTDNTALNGTLYYYVVVAHAASSVTGGANSANSLVVSAIPSANLINPPANLKAKPGDGKVTLTWDAGTNAGYYIIYYSGNGSNGYYQSVGYTYGLSFEHIVQNGWPGWYYITSMDAYGSYLAQSEKVTATAQSGPAMPTNLLAVARNGSVDLSWTASATADYYTIKRSTTGGAPYQEIQTNHQSLTFTDTGVSNGETYTYVVSATNAAGIEGSNSSPKSATPLDVPAKPMGVTATAGDGQVTLSWSASARAQKYYVYYSTSRGGTNGSYLDVGNTNSSTLTLTHTGLTNGTTYYYIVKAWNAPAGYSAPSDEKSATPISPPGKPTGLTATAGNQSVQLTWTATATATSYTLKRTHPGGTPWTKEGITATTYTDDNPALTNGTTYTYVVVAVNTGGSSPDSDPDSATPRDAPNTPTNLQATAAYKQITLNWDYVSGADHYNVERSLDGTNFSVLTSVQTTTYTNTGLTTGTRYYYRVVAVDANGVESNPSVPVSAVPPPRFEITNINNGDVLSGYTRVLVTVYDSTLPASDLLLKLDNNFYDICSPISAANTLTDVRSVLLTTHFFTNGSHTLTITDESGNQDERTVIFQNNVSNVGYDQIIDVTPGITDVPSTSHITATVASNTSWTLAVTDDSDPPVVVRTFTGTGANVDVTWDGLNDAGATLPNGVYSIFLSTGLSGNGASSVRTETSIQRLRKISSSTQIAVTGIRVDNARWSVEIQNEKGHTIKTFRSTKPTINLIWDGRDEAGITMPNGHYTAFITVHEPPSTSSPKRKESPTGGVEVRQGCSNGQPTCGIFPDTNGDGLPDYIRLGNINKHHFSDSLVVMDLAMALGGPQEAVDYLRYIRTQISSKVFQTFNFQCYPILINTGKITSQDAARINKEFETPKKLIYIHSHGGLAPVGTFSTIPGFVLGKYSWCSNLTSTRNNVTSFNVREKVSALGYGDSLDPPKLVWMDNCQSGGGALFDANAPSVGGGLDTQWAECFGLDNANGYEGVFLGVSGLMFYGTDSFGQTWRTWRYNLWYNLMTEGRNFLTAFNRTQSLTPRHSAVGNKNPHDRFRWYGTYSTAF